jgi:hypothetical protein
MVISAAASSVTLVGGGGALLIALDHLYGASQADDNFLLAD